MCMLKQGPSTIMLNDWVLLKLSNRSCIGRVSEMACIVEGCGTYQNAFWCADCCTADGEHTDGSIWVRKGDLRGGVLAWSNDVAVTVLSHHDRGEHVQFQYVW